jgi:hypothetical protein
VSLFLRSHPERIFGRHPERSEGSLYLPLFLPVFKIRPVHLQIHPVQINPISPSSIHPPDA